MSVTSVRPMVRQSHVDRVVGKPVECDEDRLEAHARCPEEAQYVDGWLLRSFRRWLGLIVQQFASGC